MQETSARTVLLVRAFEEADPDGVLLTHAERRRAAGERDEDPARPAAGADELERLVARRADTLYARLIERVALVDAAAAHTGRGAVLAALLAAGAFVLGLGLTDLGPRRHINVLSFPLLGLMAWNLIAYVVLAATARRSVSVPRPRGLAGALARAAAWLAAPHRFFGRARPRGEQRIVAAALQRFGALWLRAAAGLHRARARLALHLAAAALGAGAIAGMYLRGLVFEYRATWESTFLDAGEVHALLVTILAPAAACLGVLLPGEAALAALRYPADGPAALWIHLYAVTALLVVVAPRAALAAASAVRVRRLRAHVPLDLDDRYFRRLVRAGRGHGVRIRLVPYSYRPAAGTAALAREGLLDALGSRAGFELAEPVAYGTEEPTLARAGDDGGNDVPATDAVVLLFNAAQTPEHEIHGRWLEAWHVWQAGDRGARQVLVLLDETAYRARVADARGAGDGRVEERSRGWQRLVEESGLTMVRVTGRDDELDLGEALCPTR